VADVGARAGDRLDLGARLGVDDQVQVDRRMRPPAQRGQVGDRRRARHAQASEPPEPAQHLGAAGVGRDDDVRALAGDQPQQSPAAEARGQRAGQPAGGREPADEPVLHVV
jgi:hypothetical protein